jgi:hypothetical protein
MFNVTEYPAEINANDRGKDLVLGTKFSSVRSCTMVAFRYFKAQDEAGETRTGYIYGPGGVQVGTTGPFHDSSCRGPRWVQVPLIRPIRTQVGIEYTTAVDNVKYYAKTDDYPFFDKDGDLRPNGGVFGVESGSAPTFDAGNTNYWVDGTLL